MILIADSHISIANENHEPFFQMLEKLEQTQGEIVFLGDIFDLWISLPRYEEPIQKRFLAWCRRARESRTIGFVEGNREFYVAEEKRDCFTWCTHDARLDKARKILFVHGDQINRNDKNYLRFRKLTKNPLIKKAARYLPLGPRFAQSMKRKLKMTNKEFRIGLPRKQVAQFADRMFQTGVELVAVGHFHQEYLYRNGRNGCLQVVPDWFSTGKVGVFRPDQRRFDLLHWSEVK